MQTHVHGMVGASVAAMALVTALLVPQHPVAAAKPGGITDLGTLGGD
jgi:hypothetical protein